MSVNRNSVLFPAISAYETDSQIINYVVAYITIHQKMRLC